MEQAVSTRQTGAAEPVRRQIAPLVDIYENDEQLLLIADLPGVDRQGLQISLDPPELRIEGRAELADGESVDYVRVFRVDERIDPDGISAALNAGVLRIQLKKSAALRPRRIQVAAG